MGQQRRTHLQGSIALLQLFEPVGDPQRRQRWAELADQLQDRLLALGFSRAMGSSSRHHAA